MVEFTVYDPVTGVVLRWGDCALEDWALQAQEGEVLWPVYEALKDDEWKIVDGEKVRIGD